MAKTKKALFLVDLVVNEEVCNLRCRYCYSFHSLKRVQPPLWLSSEAFDRILKIISLILSEYDLGILKLSGGEIFLYDNLSELLTEISPRVPRIQLQTNGTLLCDRVVNEIATLGNVGIQFTLDGHLAAMNAYRTNAVLHKRLLHNLLFVLKAGIPVEINCCLHKKNMDHLETYSDFVARLPGNVVLNFIPVRYKKRNTFFPHPEKAEIIDRLADNRTFTHILPPSAVLQRLSSFIRLAKKRYTYSCFLPFVTLGMDDQGLVKACPFLATDQAMSLGNLLKGNHRQVFEQVQYGKIHKLLQHPRLHPIACQECFSCREPLNFYLSGVYTEEQLHKYWLINEPRVLAILRSIYASIHANCESKEVGRYETA